MVNDGILEGIYKVTEDNTFDDVKTFSSFLYCIFFFMENTTIMK